MHGCTNILNSLIFSTFGYAVYLEECIRIINWRRDDSRQRERKRNKRRGDETIHDKKRGEEKRGAKNRLIKMSSFYKKRKRNMTLFLFARRVNNMPVTLKAKNAKLGIMLITITVPRSEPFASFTESLIY